jgi:hypothetical protein
MSAPPKEPAMNDERKTPTLLNRLDWLVNRPMRDNSEVIPIEVGVVRECIESHAALVAALEKIARGNRLVLSDRTAISRDELLACIDVVADCAEAALKGASNG